jgi:predicted HTH transcriptional regulator
VAELLPRSNVTVARFSGDNGSAQLIEAVEVKGNLLTQYETILEFINRYTDLSKDRPKRKLALVTDPWSNHAASIISTRCQKR